MTFERLAVLVLVVIVLGLAILPHSDSVAAAGGALSGVTGVTGAIDANGNATVWVVGSDRSIRVCSALIPVTAEQRPTCTKSALLP